MPESPERLQQKYAWDKDNTTKVWLKLNNRLDADILERLSEEESRQGYIKSLIRADIERRKSE